MAWSSSDLSALEDAIKQGVRRVQYQDKIVDYRSLSEMLELRNLMKRELSLTADYQRIKTHHSKGLD